MYNNFIKDKKFLVSSRVAVLWKLKNKFGCKFVVSFGVSFGVLFVTFKINIHY